jgi:hypothetical protein
MKTITALACSLSVILFSGCMTTPGDGYTVHDDDWNTRYIQRCVCLREPCDCRFARHYLPLTFSGYTENPSETVHIETWEPSDERLRNAFQFHDSARPSVSDSRDQIYLASRCESLGRIDGKWERIATVQSMGTELPGGWYNWNASIDFYPRVLRSYGFPKEPNRDNRWRFDFRAVGENGNVLYCWKQGFHNYFLSEEDLLRQYAEHMADEPGVMSIFYDRND